MCGRGIPIQPPIRGGNKHCEHHLCGMVSPCFRYVARSRNVKVGYGNKLLKKHCRKRILLSRRLTQSKLHMTVHMASKHFENLHKKCSHFLDQKYL